MISTVSNWRKVLQQQVPAAPAKDRDALRLAVATRDYPRILFWSGAIVAAFSILTWFTESDRVPLTHVVDAVAVALLVGGGVLLTWGGVAVARQPWVFAAVGALFVMSLLYNVTIQQTPVLLTYAAVVLCALGPSTLAWRPYLVAAGAVLVTVVAVTSVWPEGHWVDWSTVSLLAACVGCVLLAARLRGIRALADSNAFARQLATTDQLTGLLNRHGFIERVPALEASANRLDRPVFAVFVDIRGLKNANDKFGHEFGDRVIQAAARAVTESVRADDLVARWGGDETIVVGLGPLPEAEAFNRRLQAQKRWTGDEHGKWSGELSVGFAEGRLSVEAIDDIIGRADEDMYRRRQDL